MAIPHRSGACFPVMCLCVLALCLFSAAAGEDAAGDGFSGEIVIGATFPLTGYLETYGQSAYYGAMTAVKIINDEGGINGKRLRVVWRDNKSDSRQAIVDIETMVAEHHVPAVIGPLLSEAAMAVRPVAERLKVVVISPMAALDALAHDNPWLFRTCFNNTAQAVALSRFQIEKYGAARGGILFDPRFEFSVELADAFEREFVARGGKIVGKLPFVDSNWSKEYAAPLRMLADAKPDFIFAASYALEATEIVHAARDLAMQTRLCGPHTWDNELVFDASGSRLAGTAFTSSLFEREFTYRPFRVFFNAMEQAGMDNPDAQAAYAYDAVNLLAQGFREGETAVAVRRGILAVRRQPLATGRLTINARGEAVKSVLIRIVERRGGHMVPVYAERYDP